MTFRRPLRPSWTSFVLIITSCGPLRCAASVSTFRDPLSGLLSDAHLSPVRPGAQFLCVHTLLPHLFRTGLSYTAVTTCTKRALNSERWFAYEMELKCPICRAVISTQDRYGTARNKIVTQCVIKSKAMCTIEGYRYCLIVSPCGNSTRRLRVVQRAANHRLFLTPFVVAANHGPRERTHSVRPAKLPRLRGLLPCASTLVILESSRGRTTRYELYKRLQAAAVADAHGLIAHESEACFASHCALRDSFRWHPIKPTWTRSSASGAQRLYRDTFVSRLPPSRKSNGPVRTRERPNDSGHLYAWTVPIACVEQWDVLRFVLP